MATIGGGFYPLSLLFNKFGLGLEWILKGF